MEKCLVYNFHTRFLVKTPGKINFIIFPGKLLNVDWTLYFVNSMRNPQEGRSICSSFVVFDHSDKIVTCLKNFLWITKTYTHQIVHISSAQFDLVMRNSMTSIFSQPGQLMQCNTFYN